MISQSFSKTVAAALLNGKNIAINNNKRYNVIIRSEFYVL